MTKEEILTDIKKRLGNKIVQWQEKSPKRYYIEVAPVDIPETTRYIFRELGARFQIATAIDTPSAIEVLYHWAFDSNYFVVTVKTKLNRENPEVESVAWICPATEWIEREMWELLGVNFKHHPDLRHLLLLDNWPEGQYPLRRDFKGINQ